MTVFSELLSQTLGKDCESLVALLSSADIKNSFSACISQHPGIALFCKQVEREGLLWGGPCNHRQEVYEVVHVRHQKK